LLGGHQQHLKLIFGASGVGQVLDQHHLRPALQQAARHVHAVLQRLRSAATEAVQLQLVGAQDVSPGGRLVEQELADFCWHDAALLRVPHDRVTQVQSLWVHRLDPLDAGQNRPTLFGTAQVTGQHRVAMSQLADVGNAFHQRRNLRRGKHFTCPLAILCVIGELHGIERPHVDPDALHGKHRGAVAGVAEHHVGLNGEQVRGTFHAGGFQSCFRDCAQRSMNLIATCTTGQGRS